MFFGFYQDLCSMGHPVLSDGDQVEGPMVDRSKAVMGVSQPDARE
jgi:hypothetical protein